jgi:aminopeptidase N
METPVTEFSGWSEYSATAYGKGATFLHDIKQKYGSDDLYKILNNYYNKFKFKNATSQDFFNIYQEILGVEY